MLTYKVAHNKLFELLASNGWRPSSPSLKVRHITSPDGRLRLWMRPQAIYLSRTVAGRPHAYADARSLHVDFRSSIDLDIIAAMAFFS